MTLLLSTANYQDALVISGVLLAAILIFFGIIVGLKRSEKRTIKMATKKEPKTMNLKLKNEYITKKELAFLNAIHKALPSDFIAFPKVGLANLLAPSGDKISYNLVSDKVVDVCVFTKETMEPILVIDLIEYEVTAIAFNKMNEVAKKAIKIVKLPIIEIEVKDSYDINKLRRDLLTAMPDKIVTMLKNNLMK